MRTLRKARLVAAGIWLDSRNASSIARTGLSWSCRSMSPTSRRGGWPVVVPSASFRTSRKCQGRRAMFLPAQYAWFEPVLIATIVVFIIDLIGNSIGFGNRFLSAIMSSIVFALVFGTLVYFGYGSVTMSVTTTPSTTAPAQMKK